MGSLRITATVRDATRGRDLINENQKTVTTTGDNFDFRRATITQAGEITHTVDTDVGNAGYCVIVNRDATNYIRVGFATGAYFLRLQAGQSALIPLEPTVAALYLIADTADCEAEILVHEA